MSRVNAKHSMTLLRGCHSVNQHCSITSCTLLSRLQKRFFFKCMFKGFPHRALGRINGGGRSGRGEDGREVEVLCFSFTVLRHERKFATLCFLSYMLHWVCWMSNNRRAISSKHVSGGGVGGGEHAGELKETQMSHPELFLFPGTATFSHLNTQFT